MNDEIAKQQRAVSDFWLKHSIHLVNEVFNIWFKDETLENWQTVLTAAQTQGFCINSDDCPERHPEQDECSLFEPMQHFAVDDFLGHQLIEHKEVVIPVFDFNHVWLRQTFGQACSLDTVIVDIFNKWQQLPA